MGFDLIFHPFQGIVDTGYVAHRVIGQFCRVGQILLHRNSKLGPVTVKLHRKPTVLAYVYGLLRVTHQHTRFNNGLARFSPLRVGLAHDGHGKRIILDRVGLYHGEVLTQRLDKQLRLRDLLRIVFQSLVLHFVLLGGVVRFQHFQLRHLHVQVHFLPDTVIAGSQGLDLGVGEGGGVHVLDRAGGGFSGHDLPDKFLLALHQPPVIGVKGPLGDIAVHFDFLIHVALPQGTARPLLQIRGTPWAVQVVRRHNAVLDVGAGPHFLRTANQDAYLPLSHLGEQFRLLRLCAGVMDKSDLFRGDALGDQLGSYIVIDVKFAIPLRRRQVAEYQLRTTDFLAFPPDLEKIFHTGIYLAVWIVRQKRIL